MYVAGIGQETRSNMGAVYGGDVKELGLSWIQRMSMLLILGLQENQQLKCMLTYSI